MCVRVASQSVGVQKRRVHGRTGSQISTVQRAIGQFGIEWQSQIVQGPGEHHYTMDEEEELVEGSGGFRMGSRGGKTRQVKC